MDNKIRRILTVAFATLFIVSIAASAVSARSVDVSRTDIRGSTITGGSAAASVAGGLYESSATSHDLVIRSDLGSTNSGVANGGDVNIVTGTVDNIRLRL